MVVCCLMCAVVSLCVVVCCVLCVVRCVVVCCLFSLFDAFRVRLFLACCCLRGVPVYCLSVAGCSL